MDKIKEKLHIGSKKSQPENDVAATSGSSKTAHSTTFDSGPGYAPTGATGATGTHDRNGSSIEDSYGT